MTAVRARAPTLAWLLTALTCLLAGMAIVESRHQTVALPHPEGTRPPVGAAGIVEVADPPADTSPATPTPVLGWEGSAPPATPLFAEVPLWLPGGTVGLRVARITVPPGVDMALDAASGPTVLLIETGRLAVQANQAVFVGHGGEPARIDAALGAGEGLVIASGAPPYAVRNDGPSPGTVLEVTIDPSGTPPPDRGHS